MNEPTKATTSGIHSPDDLSQGEYLRVKPIDLFQIAWFVFSKPSRAVPVGGFPQTPARCFSIVSVGPYASLSAKMKSSGRVDRGGRIVRALVFQNSALGRRCTNVSEPLPAFARLPKRHHKPPSSARPESTSYPTAERWPLPRSVKLASPSVFKPSILPEWNKSCSTGVNQPPPAWATTKAMFALIDAASGAIHAPWLCPQAPIFVTYFGPVLTTPTPDTKSAA